MVNLKKQGTSMVWKNLQRCFFKLEIQDELKRRGLIVFQVIDL